MLTSTSERELPVVGIGTIGTGPLADSRARAYAALGRLPVPPKVLPVVRRLAGDLAPRNAASAERSGIPTTQTAIDDLFGAGRRSIGIVDLCGGPDTRHISAIAAAEAGLAVVCHPPLAPTADEAYSVWWAAVQSFVQHTCVFPLRFSPAVWRARETVAEGALGGAVSVEVEAEGAALSEAVDLLRFVTGREIGSVLLPHPSSATAALRFADGLATLRQAGDGATTRLTVKGSTGRVVFDAAAPGELEIFGERVPISWGPEFPDSTDAIDRDLLVAVAAADFIHTVLSDDEVGPRAATLEDGYRASEVLAALDRSRGSGHAEPVHYRECEVE